MNYGISRSLSPSRKNWEHTWRKHSAVLGVLPPSSVADPPPINAQGSPSNSDEDHRKSFTDDVLIIEKQGPNMPLLSLADLPGLFRAERTEQDEARARRRS